MEGIAENRYKRYGKLNINPICSESDSDNNSELGCSTHVLSETQKTKRIIHQREITTQEVSKKKKKVKACKAKESSLSWDTPQVWGLPHQCLSINQQHKKECHQELLESILSCLQGRSKCRVIFLTGKASTAKKTVLFDVLNTIRSMHSLPFKEYFLSFQEEIDNDVPQKITKLYEFLEMNVISSIKSLLMADTPSGIQSQSVCESQGNEQNLMEQQRSRWKLQNIIVLNNYKSFITTLKHSPIYQDFNTLMRANRSSLLIFVGTPSTTREMGMFAADNYLQIRMPKNDRGYFMASLLATVNNYPFLHEGWEFLRPLANYFSVKMYENDSLCLSTIRKLIIFLENEGAKKERSEESARTRVSREVLEGFMNNIMNQSMKVDLRRLTIHEKAVITACYLSLKEEPDILVSLEKVYKRYVWICQSLSMSVKSAKEFNSEVIYQLETYKIIKLEKQRDSTSGRGLLLKVDLHLVKWAFEQEWSLSKFFLD